MDFTVIILSMLTQHAETLQGYLATAGKLQRRVKGQVIQTTSGQKNFNLIRSGYVKSYLIANDGSLGVVAIFGPADVFCITLAYKALFGKDLYDGPEVYYFEAMSDCEIYTIDATTLAEHISTNPMLYRDLMLEAGKRMHTYIQGLENITMRSAYSRTAHQLLYYARQFGRNKPSGIEIGVPLTHQDLANVLSLSRETVSVSITALRAKGLIRGGKKILVIDIDKLEEEAYS